MSDSDGTDIDSYAGVLNLANGLTGIYGTFKDCTFRNNYARHGGVFFLSEGNNVEIIDCTFENNQAIEGSFIGGYGGCISSTFTGTANISNSNFYNNTASFKGGALYGDYGTTYTISNTVFESNTAPGGHGGAIFFEDRNSQSDGTYVVIKNSNFIDNSADRFGGAICLFNGIFPTITGCTFDGNSAQLGGAIVNFDDIVYEGYSGNTFLNNEATEDSTYNDIYNESFSTTTALSDSGSIETGNLTYYLTLLDNNKDVTSEYNTLVSQSSTICYVDIENTCQGPGCNSIDGSSWSKAYTDLQDCMDDISSTGEIWVTAGTYKPTKALTWADGTSAVYYGFTIQEGTSMYGGFTGTETLRSQRDFKNNPTILSCSQVSSGKDCSILLDAANNCIVDGFIFTGSSVSSGSGARRARNRRLLNDGGVYTTTISAVLSATNGGRGGGIFSNGTNIIVVNSVFYDMISTKGGGMYCIGSSGSSFSAPTIVNAAFAGNTAERGGAIAGDVGCDFICNHCWMLDNRVVEKGGAIYLDYFCDPVINETTFKGNVAYESGGCIAADGGSLVTMKFGRYINNYGEWEGGCLYAGSKSSDATQGFYLTNPYFSNNEAPYGHEDVYLWWDSAITLDNIPTSSPTQEPTNEPTEPTIIPTIIPTDEPTVNPTDIPTKIPTDNPTGKPTNNPTSKPTNNPVQTSTSTNNNNDDDDDDDSDDSGPQSNVSGTKSLSVSMGNIMFCLCIMVLIITP